VGLWFFVISIGFVLSRLDESSRTPIVPRV